MDACSVVTNLESLRLWNIVPPINAFEKFIKRNKNLCNVIFGIRSAQGISEQDLYLKVPEIVRSFMGTPALGLFEIWSKEMESSAKKLAQIEDMCLTEHRYRFVLVKVFGLEYSTLPQ